MNLAVFGLAVCVLGAGLEGPADTSSIWIQLKGSESSKEYDRDHPIFKESNLLRNMVSRRGNVEMKEKDSFVIPYREYAFDIVTGLLREEPKSESDNIPISFEQLLHVFDLISYLGFNTIAAKNISRRLFLKTLDGKSAESIFAAPRNNEVHTPLAYFLCLKAYTETHGLHMCINANSSAVTICAWDDLVNGVKYGSDNVRLPSIHFVRILPEVYSILDRNAMSMDPDYRKDSEHVVNTILKICKEADIEELDVRNFMRNPNDFEVLGQMKSLKFLDLSRNELSNDSMKEILKLASLEKLLMRFCDIEKWDKFDGIENMTSLKHLELAWSTLSNNTMKAIFKLTKLEELIMNECSIKKEYKFDGIESMTSLKHLDFGYNELSNDAIKLIFTLASLEGLTMKKCGIKKRL